MSNPTAASHPGDSPTVPLGILRMGLTNFPVAQINGQDERLNVDVAVLDTGIQIDTTNLATNAVFNTTLHGPHPVLPNVVQAVGFADPGYYGDDWLWHGTRNGRHHRGHRSAAGR